LRVSTNQLTNATPTIGERREQTFVEKQNGRVLQNGASDGDPLFLATAERDAALCAAKERSISLNSQNKNMLS
jgi:hypothetical protein